MAGRIVPKEYSVKLAGVKEMYPSVKLFTFEFEDKFHFNPGQFVILEIKDDGGNIVKRSYSLSSYPGSRSIELCMNILPEGKMTAKLDKMRIGDKIKLIGPHGKFGEGIEKSERDIVFIAAGTGITPIKCLLDHLLKGKFSGNINLIYGFRHEDHYLFKDELSLWKKKNKNLSVLTTVSRPHGAKKWVEDGGVVGRVTDYLDKELKAEGLDKEFYICGLAPMVRDTKALLLKKGVDPQRIHIEAW